MKKALIVVLIVIVVIAAGVAGYAIHGTMASAPSKQTTTQQSGTASTSTPSTGTPTSSSDDHCTATDLTAPVTAQTGGAAAGNRYYSLTVTNTAAGSCVLNGYPGVSLTNDSGAQIGNPADKDTATPAGSVTLAKGESATATLHTAVSDNYPSGTCKDGATMVKIYPPNATDSLSTASPITSWCPSFTTTGFTKS